jgi:hypothetical protein
MNIRHAFVLSLAISSISFAQYPQIPADVAAAGEARRAEAAARAGSKEAHERAKAVVEEWAKKGKPYIPWAATPSDLPQAAIPAFPGAYGGGMYSHGGRGGRVYVVTTLADHGPGSFREALESGGPRIVVFNVAGIIRLDTRISIRSPYITIAGNTAPGDGVCIAGNSVEIDTHDVVIRHMRFRRGSTDVTERNDSFGGNPIGNIMIDHVSASWGLDENMSMYRHMYSPPNGTKDLKLPTVNISIQNSIFSEGLNTWNHAFGSTIGGFNSTFHRNLWACNTGRNPSVGMNGDFGMFNNVIFNWVHRTTDGGDHLSFYNIINNYWKPGPATPMSDIRFRILKPEARRSKDKNNDFGKAYVAGNVVEGNDRVTRDNWDGGVQSDDGHDIAEVLKAVRVDKPLPHSVPLMSATDAFEYVLANAGATLPKRDAVDERVVKMVRTGEVPQYPQIDAYLEKWKAVKFTDERATDIRELATKGIIYDPAQVGGWPEYKGEPLVDSDWDGMPDEWEKANGLNAFSPQDASEDLDGDGYTNIEEYINGTDVKAKVDYSDPKNNVDVIRK